MGKQTQITDALGNEIIIGHPYGYSSTDGGWAKTTQGIAKNITASGRVTLEITYAARFLYGDPIDFPCPAKTVSVRSYQLFPILRAAYRCVVSSEELTKFFSYFNESESAKISYIVYGEVNPEPTLTEYEIFIQPQMYISDVMLSIIEHSIKNGLLSKWSKS